MGRPEGESYLVAIAIMIGVAQGGGFGGVAQMDAVLRRSGRFLLSRLRSRWRRALSAANGVCAADTTDWAHKFKASCQFLSVKAGRLLIVAPGQATKLWRIMTAATVML
jgi:hypothetical protein